MKKLFLFLILLFVLLFLVRRPALGLLLEKPLEKKLTDLFGMPVYINGLRIDPLSGEVHADRIRFMNQPEYTPGPHLDTQIDFDIRFLDLAHKRINIGTLLLTKPYYFIESFAPDEKNQTLANVRKWVRHIKNYGDEDTKKEGKKEEEEDEDWPVTIGKIILRDCTFIYQKRIGEQIKRKFVFEQLEGELTGFHWPTPNPASLPQKVSIKGIFGENYPAPFWIKGRSNFATSTVSFNLKGEIPEGILIEHRSLWQGMPIKVAGGSFKLKSHVLCIREKMRSHNELVLKSLQVKPGRSAVNFIRGVPLMATIRFLQSQENINLNVPVHGDISDPQFEFSLAFRKAFQQSFSHYTRLGIEVFRRPVQMMTQTGEVMLTTPAKMAEQMGKISEMMKNAPLPSIPLLTGKKEMRKREALSREQGTGQSTGSQMVSGSR